MAWRAAQAVVVRARQPPSRPISGAVKAKPGAAAQRAQGGQAQAGLTGVSAEKAVAVEKLRRRRRRAEKDENVMHLVCWGPN
ncbi:unnamed protein product [Miscanthus lutarioriparius]|uniref:Uncharacterized protein n=1 Tax=Miscanthus lutarioriparius TaxID=422564 RepID=A0A811QZV9_9POAL|nr:unnamed protein product [Miscanthus lutarioriparius]